jgi:hypothetical protein
LCIFLYWECKTEVTLLVEVKKEVENWEHVDLVIQTEFKEGEIDYLGLEFEENWYQTGYGPVGGGQMGLSLRMERRQSRKWRGRIIV